MCMLQGEAIRYDVEGSEDGESKIEEDTHKCYLARL